MIVGGKDYQLNLSKLAYGYNGALSMSYLESVGYKRARELNDHLSIIASELKSGE